MHMDLPIASTVYIYKALRVPEEISGVSTACSHFPFFPSFHIAVVSYYAFVAYSKSGCLASR